ncbi:MAG: methyl-accepting chemotaxis protein [Candidatus Tectimicrobiota bacterium]
MAFVTRMQDAPLGVKLGVITGLMCVPLLLLLSAFLALRQEAIGATRQALAGLEYVLAVTPLLDAVSQHRDLAVTSLRTSAQQPDRLLPVQSEIEQAFKTLETVEQRLGALLGSATAVPSLSRRWQELKRHSASWNPREIFAQHTQLLQELYSLLQQLDDASGLRLDPELGTSHLIATALHTLPDMLKHLSSLRGVGGMVAARKSRTTEEQIRLHLAISQVQSSAEAMHRSVQVGTRAYPVLERALTPLSVQAAEKMQQVVQLVQQQLLQPEAVTLPPLEFLATATEAFKLCAQLQQDILRQLQVLLQERLQRLTSSRNVPLLLAGALTLLVLGLARALHRFITRQLVGIRMLCGHIATGDYAARAPVLSADDLGMITASLNAMLDDTLTLVQSQAERDAIQRSIMKLLEEVAGVAEGNLAVEAEVTTDMTGTIADAFNYMIHQLRVLVAQVQEAAMQVSASAHAVHTTAAELAQGSTMQATQIIESSAALDAMVGSIQDVSAHAVLSATVAEQALNTARQGTLAVQNTIRGMQRIRSQVQETAGRIKRLGERSQEIGAIVQLIGDIADRTSIVALNASIQAARAGEAGRAFAVVAEEVERLAERAATATRQIAGLVRTIQSETTEAVTAMEESTREVVQGSGLADQAGQALGEIETVSTRLAGLIQSISLAAKQQARGSESLSRAMGDISEITQQTAVGIKQAVVSIDHLASMAETLRSTVSTFQLPTTADGHRP